MSGAETELGVKVEGHHGAYVIYTSGSTGRPKGVVNVHAGLLNQLLWRAKLLKLTSEDRVVQKTPISFDVSVWELFTPLIVGAEIVLAEPGGHRDPVYLRKLIEGAGITAAHFVPSALRHFLDAFEGAEDGLGLRNVICSGETLSADLVKRFFEVSSGRLHNLYGPTEASIDVSAWECMKEAGEAGRVPIGRPIANTQLYVLDGEGREAPIGVVGELYIGGVALARGYHGRADLTAERFIPNPLDRGVTRLYRTGRSGEVPRGWGSGVFRARGYGGKTAGIPDRDARDRTEPAGTGRGAGVCGGQADGGARRRAGGISWWGSLECN